jgi:hypothetical protein
MMKKILLLFSLIRFSILEAENPLVTSPKMPNQEWVKTETPITNRIFATKTCLETCKKESKSYLLGWKKNKEGTFCLCGK